MAMDNISILIRGVLDANTSDLNAQLKKISSQLNPLSLKIQIDTREIENVGTQLNKIKANKPDITPQLDVSEVENKIQRVNNQLDRLKVNKNKVFEDSGVSREVDTLKQMEEGFRNGTVSSKEYALQMDNVRTKVAQVSGELRNVNHDGMSMTQMIELAAKKFIVWQVAVGGVMGAIHSFQEGISFLNDLDKSMTNISMITGKSRDEVVGLTKEYSSLASQLHETTSEIMTASEEFLRAGNNEKETADLLKSSTVMSKIAGQSQEESAQSLISIMNAYHMKAEDMMGVVDKMVAVDNTSATSTKELSEAIQKVASSAQEAGVSLPQLISYIGTISSVTRQSASTIGTAINSILSRYESIKEGKKFSPDSEPLNNVEKSLNHYGIAIRENATTFKSFSVVLSEVAEKWGKLNDVARNDISTQLAGTRQRNQFLALMQNMNMALDQQSTEANSAGNAMNRYGEYSKSTEAKINDLKNAVQKMWMSLLNSSEINTFVSQITKLVNGIENLSSHFNVLALALGVVGGFLTTTLISALMTAGSAITTFFASVSAGAMTFDAALGGIPLLIGLLVTGVSMATNGFGLLNGVVDQTTKTIDANSKAIEDNNKKQQDFNDLFSQYESLMSKSNAYGLNTEEKQSLLDVSNKLVDTYGVEVKGVDSITGAYIISTDAANKYTEALKAQNAELNKQNESERNKRINTNISNANTEIAPNDVDSLIKQIERYRELLQKLNQQESLTPSEKNEFDSYLKNLVQGHSVTVQNAIRDFSENNGSVDKLKSALTLSSQKYTEAIGQATKDLLTNINTELNGVIDSSGESFLNSVLTQYFSTENVDWDKIKSPEFTNKIKEFATEYKDQIEKITQDTQKYQKMDASGTLDTNGYQQYYSNLQKQAGLIQTMANKGIISASQAQKQIGQITSSIENNIGLAFSDISNKLGSSSSAFKTFSNSLISLEDNFKTGKVTMTDYFNTLNAQLSNTNFSQIFNGNKEAADEFFSTMSTKSANMLSDVINQFDSGNITVTDFTTRLTDLAPVFETLSNKSVENADALGISDTAVKQEDADRQTAFNTIAGGVKVLNDIKDANTALTNIESNNAQKGTQAYADSMNTIATYLSNTVGKSSEGFKDIQGNALHSSTEIYNALMSDSGNFNVAVGAISADTNNGVAKVAQGVGKLISQLGNDIKNFSANIKFEPKITNPAAVSFDLKDTKGIPFFHFQLPSVSFGVTGSSDFTTHLGEGLMDFGNSLANYTPNIDASKYMKKPSSGGGGFSTPETDNGGGGNGYIPAGDDGKKKKGSSSRSTPAEQTEPAELITKDRYLDLLNAEKETENQIANIQAQKALYNESDFSQASKVIELDKQEIEATKAKQNAIHNTNEERKKELAELGNINDLQTKSNSLLEEVNNHATDKDKTTYNQLKKDYDEINEKVKRYYDLSTNEIPKASQEWYSLQKNINDLTEKTRALAVSSYLDQAKSAYEASTSDSKYETYINSLKKALEGLNVTLEERQKIQQEINDTQQKEQEIINKTLEAYYTNQKNSKHTEYQTRIDDLESEKSALESANKAQEEANALAEKEIALQEKINELNNLKNDEANYLWEYTSNGWQQVVDPRKVKSLNDDIAKLQKDKDDEVKKQEYENSISRVESQIVKQKALQEKTDKYYDSIISNLNKSKDAVDSVNLGLNDAINKLASLGSAQAKQAITKLANDSAKNQSSSSYNAIIKYSDSTEAQKATIDSSGHTIGLDKNRHGEVIDASGNVWAFKDGGLMDDTGLFMGHGTKSKPELVLNAEDTPNLLKAIDITRQFTLPSLPKPIFNQPAFASGLSGEHYNFNEGSIVCYTNDATSMMNQIKRMVRGK